MDIKELKGVGPKKSALFHRLSIYDTYDLLRFFPREYEVYEKPVFVKDILSTDTGRKITVDGVIASKPALFINGRYSVVTVLIRDFEGNFIKCKWYNMPYLGRTIFQGQRFIFRGLLSAKGGERFLEQPKTFRIDEYETIMGKMYPVYSLTKGLTQKSIADAVKQALEVDGEYENEFLEESLLKRLELTGIKEAFTGIHFPEDEQHLKAAVKRMKFNDFFLFTMSVLMSKDENATLKTRFKATDDTKIREFENRLPFKLTVGQKQAWEDIKEDLSSDKAMNRLLQGDVGSGKTIIAVLALFHMIFNGYQAVLMAPTQVLATQEYNQIISLIEKNGLSIRAGLLTGANSRKEKEEVYKKAESGEIDLIVGTHALIQEKFKCKNPGLVITDEQHRFGVAQRKTLKDKAGENENPNVLVMSATPIPRTLAWVMYADLDISAVRELPKGRKPIKNAVVDTSHRPKAYRFISNEVKKGNQAYIICPLVEESEETDAENVIDYSSKLKEIYGESPRVGMLHGRMTPEAKQEIMNAFINKETDVLVSTTVIEVGINVPDATVIMIENAERFGMSQLHQLRGRVGRSEKESYCIFVSDSKTDTAKERLEIISSTNDGFEVAEKDLELRGPGEFFGQMQSGMLKFLIADPVNDMAILNIALGTAKEILKEDRKLTKGKNPDLKKTLKEYQIRTSEKIAL